MAWCFSTRASTATILTNTQSCLGLSLVVNGLSCCPLVSVNLFPSYLLTLSSLSNITLSLLMLSTLPLSSSTFFIILNVQSSPIIFVALSLCHCDITWASWYLLSYQHHGSPLLALYGKSTSGFGFPTQRAIYTESISMSSYHHVIMECHVDLSLNVDVIAESLTGLIFIGLSTAIVSMQCKSQNVLMCCFFLNNSSSSSQIHAVYYT